MILPIVTGGKPPDNNGMKPATIAVADGESLQFIENLLEQEKSAGASEVVAVKNVMSSLEALAEEDTVTALVLMARLAPKACSMHDVCDSINLWMFHNMSEEVKKHLAALLTHDPDVSTHWRYERWLEFEVPPPKP